MSTNKNSQYVRSLVSFLNDTKPYRCKITEIVEEYRFFDDMFVKLEERLTSRLTLRASSTYSFFSAGPEGQNNLPFHQTLNTNVRASRFRLQQSVDDIPSVPYVFDPSYFQGPGAKDFYLRTAQFPQNGVPLLEGHDVYLSHGAFVFSVKKTRGSNVVGTFLREYTADDAPFPIPVTLDFSADDLFIVGPVEKISNTEVLVTAPGWVRIFGINQSASYDTKYQELKNKGLFAHVTGVTQLAALDVDNPRSAVNGVLDVLGAVEGEINLAGAVQSKAAMEAVLQTLPRRVNFSEGTSTILLSQHPFIPGQTVKFDRVPTGSTISTGVEYFVVNTSPAGFQISPSLGGLPVAVGASGAGLLAPASGLLDLPRSYERLFSALADEAVPVPVGYDGYVWDDGNTPSSALPDLNTTKFVDKDLEALSIGLYFNLYTDVGQLETGNVRYDDLITPQLVVSDIVANSSVTNYEEYTLVPVSLTAFQVVGSSSGPIGIARAAAYVEPPGLQSSIRFVSTSISFNLHLGAVQFLPTDSFKITPTGEVTIHRDAPLETWSVIKTNPVSYSRPVLNSPRYGYLESLAGVRGFVDVLDDGFPAGTLVIRAISPTTFVMTSTGDPAYSRNVTVNLPYDDGRIGLRIVEGTAYQFRPGDAFFVDIENPLPVAEDFDLYYGYDGGPLDDQNSVYNNISSALDDYLRPLEFNYDTRFNTYNFSSFNLQLDPGLQSGATWRIRALPDLSRPLRMPDQRASLLAALIVRVATTTNITLVGSQTVDDVVLSAGDLVLVKNQTDSTQNGVYTVTNVGAWQRVPLYPPIAGQLNPSFPEDPPLTGEDFSYVRVQEGSTHAFSIWKRSQPQVPYTYEQTSDLYDMPTDTTSEGPWSDSDLDPGTDIQLWYASEFTLERYDEDTLSWIVVDANVPVGVPFTSSAGISFTIAPGDKPFIAARVASTFFASTDGTLENSVVETGDVFSFTVRNEPPQQLEPSTLESLNIPRLIMHGDSWYFTVPARWTLQWTSANTYTIQGVYTDESDTPNQNVFPTPVTVNTSVSRSYRNDSVGLHWTLRRGAIGMAAGDVITFDSFRRKPSYLVHGSISGWQPNAEIGEWYWNGKIGFKIDAATSQVFQNGVYLPNSTTEVIRLRPDTPSCVYRLRAVNPGRWMMYRDGELVAFGTDTLRDEYITVFAPFTVVGEEYLIRIDGDNRDLALGVDAVILRTNVGKLPTSADALIVEKTEQDAAYVSIRSNDPAVNVTLAELARVNVDPRFVDHDTQSGVALVSTSPEISITTGYVPALTIFSNADGQTVFSDEATSATLVAAATGEVIGTAASVTSNPKEPVQFTWNASFKNKYLPLNTEATLVHYGAGADDKIRVTMMEGINFLLSGGGLDTASLFSDVVGIGFTENNFTSIVSSYQSNLPVAMADGPFGGFLPGYDNMPLDAENVDLDVFLADMATNMAVLQQAIDDAIAAMRGAIADKLDQMNLALIAAGLFEPSTAAEIVARSAIEAPFWAEIKDITEAASAEIDALDPVSIGVGYYDVGNPLVGYFERAKILSTLLTPSPEDTAELELLVALIDPYLTNGSINNTTLESFQAALDIDALINRTPVPDFGIPALGAGISISDKPEGSAGAETVELITINITDKPLSHDLLGYDVGLLDAPGGATVRIFSEDLPPLPDSGLPPVGTMYDNFATPAHIGADGAPPANVVELIFNVAVTAPEVWIWERSEVQPRRVTVLEQLNDRTYRFEIPSPVEFKLIVV